AFTGGAETGRAIIARRAVVAHGALRLLVVALDAHVALLVRLRPWAIRAVGALEWAVAEGARRALVVAALPGAGATATLIPVTRTASPFVAVAEAAPATSIIST